MQDAGLDEAQAGIKIVRRNINNLRYAEDTTLMTKSKEGLEAETPILRHVMQRTDSLEKT